MRIGVILNVLVWSSVLGALGWFFSDMYQQRQQERELRESIARLTEETPCARILVHAVEPHAETGAPIVSMSWLDTDKDWKPRPGAEVRRLEVKGKEAYFDSYQIIFATDDVKQGDPLRGKTLTVFAKVFGSAQIPDDGTPLNMPADVIGLAEQGGDLVPANYRYDDDPPSELERRLWSRFWELCTDPEAAEREGIRTVQGTAVHKPMQAGMEYRLSFDNKGQILLDGPMRPDPFIDH
jgi:hypothetical protein